MESNILALVSDLYGQLTVLQQENARLRQEIADQAVLSTETGGTAVAER